jgi:hypothetical protein
LAVRVDDEAAEGVSSTGAGCGCQFDGLTEKSEIGFERFLRHDCLHLNGLRCL